MTKRTQTVKSFLILLSLAVALCAAPAMAANKVIQNAKNQGLIGEMVDGYLGLVKGTAPGNVRSEMRQVNIQRRAKYSELAKSSGVSVAVAGALTGEKLVARAKSGQYVRKSNGQWVQVQ